MEKPESMEVSRDDLLARINEVIGADSLILIRSAAADGSDLGKYFEVNGRAQAVWRTHLDLEDYARKLGVLRPTERLAVE